jgi:hypothetical protein
MIAGMPVDGGFVPEIARSGAFVQVEDRREQQQQHKTGDRGKHSRQQHLDVVLDRSVRRIARTDRILRRRIGPGAGTKAPTRPRAMALPHYSNLLRGGHVSVAEGAEERPVAAGVLVLADPGDPPFLRPANSDPSSSAT